MAPGNLREEFALTDNRVDGSGRPLVLVPRMEVSLVEDANAERPFQECPGGVQSRLANVIFATMTNRQSGGKYPTAPSTPFYAMRFGIEAKGGAVRDFAKGRPLVVHRLSYPGFTVFNGNRYSGRDVGRSGPDRAVRDLEALAKERGFTHESVAMAMTFLGYDHLAGNFALRASGEVPMFIDHDQALIKPLKEIPTLGEKGRIVEDLLRQERNILLAAMGKLSHLGRFAHGNPVICETPDGDTRGYAMDHLDRGVQPIRREDNLFGLGDYYDFDKVAEMNAKARAGSGEQGSL